VVNRYKNNPAVANWQLENEAMNNWFGGCGQPDRQRVAEEYNLVKQWDPTHPIRMSLSDQHGLPINGPAPDEYGFSVYRIVWNTFGPWHFYLVYPTPIWYHHLRAVVIDWIQHRPIFIHELQMEPWGPEDTKNLSIAEQDKSMNANQVHKSIKFARQIGAKVHGDPTIWDAVKSEIHKTESR
jgi:endo-1,4-beta-mannosidase